MAEVDQQRQGFGNGLGWRIRNRVVAEGLLFLAIPVLFLITAFELTKAKGPQWLPSGFENSYTYLFNSLLLVKGEAPQHIDHPGTTTQVLGAIVLRASSLKSTDDLIESVIRDPERHIAEIHWTLLIITFLSVWIFPWITAAVLRNYWVGLLIQVFILFYQTLLICNSPEYPLCFGDDYARRVFAPLLAGIYPKALFFNIFTGQFETFAEFVVPLAELQKHDHLYFLGDPQYFPTVDGLDPKTFETVDHAGEYYLQKWTRK